MSISLINTAADALLTVRMRTHSLAPAQPVTHMPENLSGVVTYTSEAVTNNTVPNIDHLLQALSSINQAIQKLAPRLEFAIQLYSSRTVVKVVDH